MPQYERNPKQTAISAAAPHERVEAAGEEQLKRTDSTPYEYSAEKGWPENFHPVTQVDKGPHTEFVSTPSKAVREPAVAALDLSDLGAPATTTVTPLYHGTGGAGPLAAAAPVPVPMMPVMAAPPGTGTGGFKATVPPSPAHKASTAFLGSGSHQEMVLPLSEAAPELFGGDPAAATPHYDAIGAAPASASAAIPLPVPRPQLPNAFNAPMPSGPTPQLFVPSPLPPAAAYPSAGGLGGGAAAVGGFKATVPPSPAHAASTTILGSGGHQEMVLPLSEAAPELFGGNPAAATPHYDAIGAAGTTAAPLPSTLPFAAATGANAPIITPIAGGLRAGALPTPGAASMDPQGTAAGLSGFKATVPPSPAHAASTTILGSGGHQEMVLPLSEAAPELFGGNPAAATPHYDAIGAAGVAAAPTMNAPSWNAAAAAPASIPMAPGISTVTPMASVARNFAGPAAAPAAAATPSGFKATVPPSPAHQASTAFLSAGSHQEMVLPLSEAAPELFGGNPAAATPHYDAIGATGAAAPMMNAPSWNAAAAAPASIPMAPGISTVTPMASVARNFSGPVDAARTPPARLSGGAPAQAKGLSGFQSTVPPSPAHAASKTFLGEGGHQEMVLPLSEAAPELFGGNPAASTPHYDAVGSA